MNLVFLIYGYFPYGGQQRDFLRVALACAARGHRVRVYTMKWQGEKPAGLDIRLLDIRAWTRLACYRRFTQQVAEALKQEPAELVIGFNKMPGLDVYFAADPCFAERAQTQRGFYYRFTPRYHHFSRYESAVFGPQANTRALLLSPLQREQFAHYYPGSETRFVDIPPGIEADRRRPENAAEIRAAFRHEMGLGEHDLAIVQIGSGFVIKGLDRSLHAIASLPQDIRKRVHYFVVGQDKPDRFLRLASRLGIVPLCRFLGGRDDVPRFLLGGDLLLHPAYSESAGYVLLEATIAGLPVLTTATCGYAFHIERAGSGIVCPQPFEQQTLNRHLQTMLEPDKRQMFSRQGIEYGRSQDLYSMPETVAGMIERFVHEANLQRGNPVTGLAS
ncbi:MAG: glycosyltransferase family 4 protein [Gammaproteobacteria bacterium]